MAVLLRRQEGTQCSVAAQGACSRVQFLPLGNPGRGALGASVPSLPQYHLQP